MKHREDVYGRTENAGEVGEESQDAYAVDFLWSCLRLVASRHYSLQMRVLGMAVFLSYGKVSAHIPSVLRE